MADIVITIEVSSVQYTTWLRSSYIASSKVSEDGIPMIDQYEFGPDQEDAFLNFMDESTREVLKLFSSRQGDVVGIAFEYIPGQDVIYRFNELTPLLNSSHADALKSQLSEDVKNAVYSHLSILWFNFKSMGDMEKYFRDKYEKLSMNIERNLYLLHD